MLSYTYPYRLEILHSQPISYLEADPTLLHYAPDELAKVVRTLACGLVGLSGVCLCSLLGLPRITLSHRSMFWYSLEMICIALNFIRLSVISPTGT
jgi:hypothetical protein